MTIAQRIANNAAPGSLLKRPAQPKARESATQNEGHLALVRQCACVKCGLDPSKEAAHIRLSSGAHNKHNAGAKKPGSEWTIPLCRACHQEDPDSLHKVGERSFFYLLGIEPLLLCERLHAASGDLVRMRAVIFNAIAERETVSQFRGIGRTPRGAK